MFEQLLNRDPGVFSNLGTQGGRDVVPRMKRNRRAPDSGAATLCVRIPLTNLDKTKITRHGDNFTRLDNAGFVTFFPRGLIGFR